MNRNDSPRLTNRLYDIVKDILTNKNTLDNYSLDFIEGILIEDENFVY